MQLGVVLVFKNPKIKWFIKWLRLEWTMDNQKGVQEKGIMCTEKGTIGRRNTCIGLKGDSELRRAHLQKKVDYKKEGHI